MFPIQNCQKANIDKKKMKEKKHCKIIHKYFNI